MHHRRVVLLATTLAVVLLGAGGLYLWQNLVFTGETRAIPGTPHHFVIQQGITEQDIALATDGLALADNYFVARLGHGLRNPIAVRLARTTPCIPFEPLATNPTAVADKQSICVNTVGYVWTKVVAQDRLIGLSILAHEHFHNWQAQFNCLPGPNDHEYAWWVEGSATYVGWHTLVEAGMMREEDVLERMRQWGGFSTELEPLASYEKRISGDAAYGLAYRAIAELVKRRGEQSLYQFCQQVGQGVAWRAAFEQTYGLSTDDFYLQFEQLRADHEHFIPNSNHSSPSQGTSFQTNSWPIVTGSPSADRVLPQEVGWKDCAGPNILTLVLLR